MHAIWYACGVLCVSICLIERFHASVPRDLLRLSQKRRQIAPDRELQVNPQTGALLMTRNSSSNPKRQMTTMDKSKDKSQGKPSYQKFHGSPKTTRELEDRRSSSATIHRSVSKLSVGQASLSKSRPNSLRRVVIAPELKMHRGKRTSTSLPGFVINS